MHRSHEMTLKPLFINQSVNNARVISFQRIKAGEKMRRKIGRLKSEIFREILA